MDRPDRLTSFRRRCTKMDTPDKQLIDGAWVAAQNGGTWDVVDPATEETFRPVAFGDGDDCRAAIDAAERAFPSWSARTPYERGAILRRAGDLMRERAADLAWITVRESGK